MNNQKAHELVSVIIPFYNSSKTILETLQSVEKQTYPAIEIIVVNDGSDEENRQYLKQIMTDYPHVQLVEQNNKGLPAARNAGARVARGVYFTFLDSDDIVKPDYLRACVEALHAHPRAKVAYTRAEFFGARTGEFVLQPYNGFKSLLQGNRFYCTALHRSEDFWRVGGFDESFRTHEDWEYWIRLLQDDNAEVICVPDILFMYRKHDDGSSLIDQLEREPKAIQSDWQRIYEKHRQLYLQYGLGFHDLVASLNKQEEQIKHLGMQVRTLEHQYQKYKRLWAVTLVKPLIKIEQGLSSANVYRKGFSNLVKEKGSIGKAYQYLRKLNNEQKSIHYSKLCLREYAYKKGGLTQNLSSTPISQSKQSFNLFSEMLVQTVVSNEYVPLRKGNDFCVKDIKLIAFYLPQFHPIDENDHAWGKGFTEWTNVTKAIPQYEGHHQPKLPAELGFYDLRLIDIQKRQIELAKKYGIYGFCYHHYWFDGKRVMNRPIEQILANPQLDFPFCINWANENWTKRWDGLDSEVILAQNHSVKDDLAFIEDAARYMRDHRYIKIDGKPLLMLYRPQLLPNPKETAMRWRQWCKENGLGEIFLVVSHSFEHIDPRAIGFDAAVEFAPNTFKVENITDKMRDKIINPNYSGMLFDYQSAINYSNSYKKPEYLKFRSVCPRWDNEARKPGRGITFVGSSPSKYMAWLKDVIKFTQKNHQASQQLIFINAWNEWAEGAYLEPDRRYGYAYLEATKKALLTTDNTNEKRVAVVVHAFYLDVFEEILSELKLISTPFKLFVSTTVENRVAIDNQLKTSGLEFDIFIFPNKGRDVLPFIKIMPKVVDEGFEFVLKLHTKKSKHRKDGDTWRYDLYNKLIGLERMEKALSIFDEDFNVGIIGPEGHVVQMSNFWGSNQENVLKLSKRLAVHDDNVMSLGFVAGTMFYARVEALLPVMSLGLSDNDFDDEKGQIDGTMAHGLERLFAISACSLEFKTISFDGSAYVSRYDFADSK